MSAKGQLSGQHAVVTGGGRGIGAEIARVLAGEGAAVTIMGRNAKALADMAAEHDGVAPVRCDVTDEGDVARAFGEASAAHGDISILVNNAGAASSAPFGKTESALWQSMLGVNLTGVFNCTRAVIDTMASNGSGRVVSVASTAGLTGYPYVAAYCAAKHGVIGLTRALALEYARSGVTVNAVCPGFTETDLLDESIRNIMEKTGRSEGEARKALMRTNPLGRFITSGDVADTVLWLCRGEASAITGQAIAVAGGEIMS